MKKQKLLAIVFCGALLLGAFGTVQAQEEGAITGSTYRLFIYSSAGINVNADATFQENGIFLLSIGAGSGSYRPFDPLFYASYKALGVDLGAGPVDISVYMGGVVYGESFSMLGIGLLRIPDQDSITFYFTGTRL
jgi:hypothetical protein